MDELATQISHQGVEFATAFAVAGALMRKYMITKRKDIEGKAFGGGAEGRAGDAICGSEIR